MRIIKFLYIALGSIALFLGVLGIFIPGLPCTPFLLLSAALYMRGSERLYNKLLKNKYLGKYILRFRSQKGISIRTKVYSIALMWIMIGISCFYFIESTTVIIIVLSAGVIGTIVMGFIVRTVRS